MPDQATTVGDLTAAFLEACGVETAFGVISIHNMPILDAFGRRNRTRFVPARGEAGALNMADAFARVSGGLGVGVTSTGVGAANAAGSLVEALTAGSPVLHLTGQIELPWLDRAMSYIHEAPKQPDTLKSVSKAYFRIWKAEQALGVLREAVRVALTPPMGPVSVEIPIDVQGAAIAIPDILEPPLIAPATPSDANVDALADMMVAARRPLLWLGGGARGAADAARRLADRGVGIVTSTNGRGVVPEDHPMTLGAFNASPPVETFYETCDLMVVCGSRLRGNETLKYTLKLPAKRAQIDADPAMDGRSYANDLFVHGDAAATLDALADCVDGKLDVDPAFAHDLAQARAAAADSLRESLGPGYSAIADAVIDAFPEDAAWVRDITLSNSMWGNRYLPLRDPRQGVHSLGGAIGQGLSMAVGAAMAQNGRKTVLLSGDGGFMLNVGELATAAQEQADIAVILMNDGGYGVIKNIQDAHYGSRQVYADMRNPDFGQLSASLGVPHEAVGDAGSFAEAFGRALDTAGPAIVEVDMAAVGPFRAPVRGTAGQEIDEVRRPFAWGERHADSPDRLWRHRQIRRQGSGAIVPRRRARADHAAGTGGIRSGGCRERGHRSRRRGGPARRDRLRRRGGRPYGPAATWRQGAAKGHRSHGGVRRRADRRGPAGEPSRGGGAGRRQAPDRARRHRRHRCGGRGPAGRHRDGQLYIAQTAGGLEGHAC